MCWLLGNNLQNIIIDISLDFYNTHMLYVIYQKLHFPDTSLCYALIKPITNRKNFIF